MGKRDVCPPFHPVLLETGIRGLIATRKHEAQITLWRRPCRMACYMA